MNFRRHAVRLNLVYWIALIGISALSVSFVAELGHAQTRKPTEREVAAIRDCAKKTKDDLDAGERRCIFNLVATPCINKLPKVASDHATVDCYDLEHLIWDDLLNQNYKSLLDTLDEDQRAKARAMQSAWIAYRDTTCQFYYDKIQGTMAAMMQAACAARETARRAIFSAKN